MKESFIKEFEIIGLFGYKDICIQFKNSTLIVIGENGFGKTSILNALNFILCHSYQKLLEIKFKSIRLQLFGEDYEFDYSLIEQYADYLKRNQNDDRSMIDFVTSHIPHKTLETIVSMLDAGKKGDFYTFVNNDDFLKTIPGNILYQEFLAWHAQNKSFGKLRKLENIIDSQNYTILYYPTYRRVEVDYSHLFPMDERRRSIRMEDAQRSAQGDLNIRFGMRDVNLRIQKITDIIRKTSLEGFTNVSADVIHQLLDNSSTKDHSLDCTADELRIVLDRAGIRLNKSDKDVILRRFEKNDSELRKNTSLLFYLEQLLKIYRNQEKYDSAILRFKDVCNKYLNDKQFVYDASNVTLQIYRSLNGELLPLEPENVVELDQLSSGEKQIVSIFSQIYLELDKKYAILFDEPELSLSIFWQENLLPDILASGSCEFLMAVTHSPFIFSEELKQYTVGMKEFLKK